MAEREGTAHPMRVHTFKKPTWCGLCGDFIFGVRHQGVCEAREREREGNEREKERGKCFFCLFSSFYSLSFPFLFQLLLHLLPLSFSFSLSLPLSLSLLSKGIYAGTVTSLWIGTVTDKQTGSLTFRVKAAGRPFLEKPSYASLNEREREREKGI